MFQKIANWFKNLFNNPKVQAFEEWCVKVFTAEKALLLAQLKAFAIEAAMTAEQTGFDSDSKRKLALQQITAKAQTAGIIASASMISLAVEMAVQGLKGDSNG